MQVPLPTTGGAVAPRLAVATWTAWSACARVVRGTAPTHRPLLIVGTVSPVLRSFRLRPKGASWALLPRPDLQTRVVDRYVPPAQHLPSRRRHRRPRGDRLPLAVPDTRRALQLRLDRQPRQAQSPAADAGYGALGPLGQKFMTIFYLAEFEKNKQLTLHIAAGRWKDVFGDIALHVPTRPDRRGRDPARHEAHRSDAAGGPGRHATKDVPVGRAVDGSQAAAQLQGARGEAGARRLGRMSVQVCLGRSGVRLVPCSRCPQTG